MAITKKSGAIVASLSILIAFLLILDSDRITRAIWSYWIGNEIRWRNATIPINDSFFVFPDHDEKFLMIGRYNKADKAFPDENIIVVNYEANRSNQLFDQLREVCKKNRSCRSYHEYEMKLPSGLNKCVAMTADFEFWGKRPYHIHCNLKKSGTLAEFHGAKSAFASFEEQFEDLIISITTREENRAISLDQ